MLNHSFSSSSLYCNADLYSRGQLAAINEPRKKKHEEDKKKLEEERVAKEKALEDQHGGKEGLAAWRKAQVTRRWNLACAVFKDEEQIDDVNLADRRGRGES